MYGAAICGSEMEILAGRVGSSKFVIELVVTCLLFLYFSLMSTRPRLKDSPKP